MSYGIVRVAKVKTGGVTGAEIHDKRKKQYSHTNKDIDFSKSHLNYELKECDIPFRKFIKNRIDELALKRAVRKDAVVMTQLLITSDNQYFKDLNDKKRKAFFEDSYRFIKEQYGEQNIVSAIVHMDESTPHMHINLVPVTKDNRLCAKDIFSKGKLTKLHDDFYKAVGKQWGLERGETREVKQKHLEVQEYKIKTSDDKIKQQDQRMKEQRSEVKQIKKESRQAKTQNAAVKVENIKTRADTLLTKRSAKKSKQKLSEVTQELSNKAEKLSDASERVTMASQEIKMLETKLDSLKGEYAHLQGAYGSISEMTETIDKHKMFLKAYGMERKYEMHDFNRQALLDSRKSVMSEYTKAIAQERTKMPKARNPVPSHDKDIGRDR
jgi:hypothetical protein